MQGLSCKEIRKLAYISVGCSKEPNYIGTTWVQNKQAGADWFSGFLMRHPTLSLLQLNQFVDNLTVVLYCMQRR